jgi:predicted dienelactone hydrolase
MCLLTAGIALGAGTGSAARQRSAAAGDRAHRHAAVGEPLAVGTVVLRLVDGSRVVHFRGRPPQPRPLVTEIWYPARGDPSRVAVHGRPATAAGPFPLIVFGHGFDSTPTIYARLLEAWARAGYVVAAPVFPLSNEHAPGGPDEDDIVNQPRDMSFVITKMLAASAADRGILAGLIQPMRSPSPASPTVPPRHWRPRTTRATATRASTRP